MAVTAGLGSRAERPLPPTSRRGRGVGGVVYEPMVFVSDKRNAAIESGTKPDGRVRYLQRSQCELLKNPYVFYDGVPQRSV